MQDAAEVEQGCLASHLTGLDFDEVGTSYNVIEVLEAHFGKILAHLLCQEAEEIDYIFVFPAEMVA